MRCYSHAHLPVFASPLIRPVPCWADAPASPFVLDFLGLCGPLFVLDFGSTARVRRAWEIYSMSIFQNHVSLPALASVCCGVSLLRRPSRRQFPASVCSGVSLLRRPSRGRTAVMRPWIRIGFFFSSIFPFRFGLRVPFPVVRTLFGVLSGTFRDRRARCLLLAVSGARGCSSPTARVLVRVGEASLEVQSLAYSAWEGW